MGDLNLKESMEFLEEQFRHLDFTFHHYHEDGHDYLKNLWPGEEKENVMVCVYKGNDIHEPFHRHDFIYFNYAYENDYAALSDIEGNLVRVRQGECYIGQPYSGYALRSIPDVTSTIVGVLIKKEVFFRSFMDTFASDNTLFHFFLDPEKDRYSDKFLHFSFAGEAKIRPLLEIMIQEYANKKSDSQEILTSLAMTLYLLVARTYKKDKNLNTNVVKDENDSLLKSMLEYIDNHFKEVSLKELSSAFSYNPNYISSFLHEKTGKTFSEILLDKKMDHALILMKGTDLSNEEIAEALGYTSTTNFYKAFKKKFGLSPREYALKKGLKEEPIKSYPLSPSR